MESYTNGAQVILLTCTGRIPTILYYLHQVASTYYIDRRTINGNVVNFGSFSLDSEPKAMIGDGRNVLLGL